MCACAFSLSNPLVRRYCVPFSRALQDQFSCRKRTRGQRAVAYSSASSNNNSARSLFPYDRGLKVRLPNRGSTERLGGILGSCISRGDVVLLRGDLGTGKTCFARGFIRAACSDMYLQVPSPSFLLCHRYSAGMDTDLEVFHMDLWRLSSERPLVDFASVFETHVALIEWPERVESVMKMLPETRLEVYLQYAKNSSVQSSSDPWGFEEEDDQVEEEEGSVPDRGRVVTLLPKGEVWCSRVHVLEEHLKIVQGENILYSGPSVPQSSAQNLMYPD